MNAVVEQRESEQRTGERERCEGSGGGAASLALAVGAAVAIAVAAWAFFRSAYVNYDAGWALNWADQALRGQVPDYATGPTPHPLVNFVSLPISLLGTDAETGVAALSYLSVGALVVVATVLTRLWFGTLIAAITALLLLTRTSVLALGVIQYADTMFVALCLGALLVLTLRPAATWSPLALLGLAGLIRPEAWLFAGVLALWRIREGRRPALSLLAAAAAAPVIWVLCDLVVTGDPLYSFLSTRTATEAVHHHTGLLDVPSILPTRITDVIGRPEMIAGAIGVAAGFWLLRWRSRWALVGLGISLAAGVIEATAGLPILQRYILLPGTILLALAGVAIAGWRLLEDGSRLRLPWMIGGAIVALVLAAYLPDRVNGLRTGRTAIADQQRGHDDARALLTANASRLECGPIAVPSRRLQPLVMFWLERPNASVLASQLDRPAAGTYLVPANETIRRRFQIERNDVPPDDPRQRLIEPPGPGFETIASNASWTLVQRCPA